MKREIDGGAMAVGDLQFFVTRLRGESRFVGRFVFVYFYAFF